VVKKLSAKASAPANDQTGSGENHSWMEATLKCDSQTPVLAE